MMIARRLRSVGARILDVVASPLGWDVYVTATHGIAGIDALHLLRRPIGQARPHRLRPRSS